MAATKINRREAWPSFSKGRVCEMQEAPRPAPVVGALALSFSDLKPPNWPTAAVFIDLTSILNYLITSGPAGAFRPVSAFWLFTLVVTPPTLTRQALLSFLSRLANRKSGVIETVPLNL
jgi:hypothetical protein